MEYNSSGPVLEMNGKDKSNGRSEEESFHLVLEIPKSVETGL